jgi:hypothetical protein
MSAIATHKQLPQYRQSQQRRRASLTNHGTLSPLIMQCFPDEMCSPASAFDRVSPLPYEACKIPMENNAITGRHVTCVSRQQLKNADQRL